jgi:predicted ATP-binding protein involved in virulence
MLRIKRIQIQGIGPIKNLELTFDDNFNIICGQNGIGKTTILDCLAQSFSVTTSSLKKNASVAKGDWTIETSVNNNIQKRVFNISLFRPEERNTGIVGFHENSNDVIIFKTHRDIPYNKIDSLKPDPSKTTGNFSQETIIGSLPNDLKNWFVNRFLFSAQPGGLDENQLNNYEVTKECFSVLDPTIRFSRVLASSYDIMLQTKDGDIYFEYLSSGYKSCLAVLLGLIKEIELRYKDPTKFISDFDGIIFIDEIDLHLHPEWQAKIYDALKKLLPNAQIITTTHSPHIIQVAKPGEIIALARDERNEIKINPIINKNYGCQGWTVEEVLQDVMGMSETRTIEYTDAIKGFNLGIDAEDFNEATKYFEILDKMLHPENSLKKILKIQLTALQEHD